MTLILLVSPSCSAPSAPEDKTPLPAPSQESDQTKAGIDPLEEKAAAILDALTLEEKVGQLLIIGFPKDSSQEIIQEYIDRFKVSGFILFSRNYDSFRSQYELVGDLKKKNSSANPLPLFIAIDEEGGTVSRLPKGGTRFPDARQVGKAGDPELTFSIGEVIGQELSAAGINLNFAPVMDIVSSSKNKLLIRRAYGGTPEEVSLHGNAFINGLQTSGVIAAPKHFPGHGETTADSHSELPSVDADMDTLRSRELVPFISAIKNGADAIMIGHISFPKVDPAGLPATMSAHFLRDILRKELGFKGITISDDIEMSGYTSDKHTLEEGVVASFNAGLDLFLVGSTKDVQDKVLNAITKACTHGVISEERLNESVLRIIKVKLKHELRDTMEHPFEEAQSIFTSKKHKAVLQEVSSRIKSAK